jgi:hypothetical protein
LLASGARVRVIDNLSTGYQENLDEIDGDIDLSLMTKSLTALWKM